MAALSSLSPTLIDLAKRMDPDDTIADIIEMLNLTNEILQDIPFVEANGTMSHRTTARSGIPTPTWRKLYQFVQPTKSTTVQVTDNVGMLEAYAQVDKALADLNNNTAAWRLSEEAPFIEGFNQEFAQTLFYGNEGSEPEAFTGLAPRFNSLTAESADNIIVGGSADTDNTSVWLIVWGDQSVHGIYPRGSKAGLSKNDHGEVTLRTVDGNMQAYETHYRWDLGLSVRDWRQIVRIPNVELSALTKDAATGADLVDLMTQALEKVNNLRAGRAAFYCNRRVRGFLRRQMTSKVKQSTLTMEMLTGPNGPEPVMFLDGVPVRRCDSILSTESLVV